MRTVIPNGISLIGRSMEENITYYELRLVCLDMSTTYSDILFYAKLSFRPVDVEILSEHEMIPGKLRE